MRKIIRQLNCILLCICMVAALVSCGSSQSSEKHHSSDEIEIFYLNQMKTSLSPVSMHVAGTTTRDKVKNILRILSTPPKDADYTNSIPSNIMVRDFCIKNKGLTISFTRSYKNLNKVNEALMRASVVKTMVQLDTIDTVTFRVVKDAITDSQGNAIGAMNAETFVDDFDFEQDSTRAVDLVLYCPAADGSGLIKETRGVHINENIPVAQAVMQQLQKKPDSSDACATLPSSVKVLSVNVNDGICYVDLDQSIDNIDSKVSTNLRIYSIVDSLCELDQISRVQILVGSGDSASIITDNEKNGTYSPNLDFVVND
ncbi:MAG: GerMN domain-containing protein [Lachnospiraceae bacterium]|nr:GerMN domain-containing protein [Lachnospiraceae bacterium]